MTESAAISSMAQKDCLNMLDVERYEILATLDSRTSEICRSLDGKVFAMKDYEVGVTAPPFHPYCRTTTVPYFDDEFTVGEERVARDEGTGKTYYVPGDMTYKEWKKIYVDGTEDADVKVKNNKHEQNFRPVVLSEEKREQNRGRVMIRSSKLESAQNHIRVSDRVKLKPKQAQFLDTHITEALRVLGIEGEANLPEIIIITASEMQSNALVSYNFVQNTMYIMENAGTREELLKLQSNCTMPGNELSTFVHEFIHWKDAEDYRRSYGRITDENGRQYLERLRKKCKKALDKLGIQEYNAEQISPYASDSLSEGKFDETYTEYCTKIFLERRKE